MNKVYIAFDPSINSIGFARLDTRMDVIQTATFKVAKRTTRQDQLMAVRVALKSACYIYAKNATHVICEYPDFMNSKRGKIAATQGHTLGLAYVCGYVNGMECLASAKKFLPTPMDWKGTTPKGVTLRRFMQWIKHTDVEGSPTDHEVDAAMMIKWCAESTGDTLPHVSWQPL